MDDEIRVTHIEIDGMDIQITSIPADDDDDAVEATHFHAVQTPIDDQMVAEQIETDPDWESLIAPGEEWESYGHYECSPRGWLN